MSRQLITTAVLYRINQIPNDVEEVATLFASWKAAYGKAYASPLEDALRRDVFEDNARLVAAHNSQRDATFTMELNQFADITWYVSSSELVSLEWGGSNVQNAVDDAGRSSRSGTLGRRNRARQRTGTSRSTLYFKKL